MHLKQYAESAESKQIVMQRGCGKRERERDRNN